MTKKWWVAVLDPAGSVAALREELHEIPLPRESDRPLPGPGDRVAVLTLPNAVFVGLATAGRLRPSGRAVLRLHERIRAPLGHEVDPFTLRPRPACTARWTRERLSDMTGTFTAIAHRDGLRIESAILAQALAHGPTPKRPAHDRPRTPGRRALMEGRAASGTLGARRR